MKNIARKSFCTRADIAVDTLPSRIAGSGVKFVVIELHEHCTISCSLFYRHSFPLTAHTIGSATLSCSPFLEQTAHLSFSVLLLFLSFARNVLPFPSCHPLARLLCILQGPITETPPPSSLPIICEHEALYPIINQLKCIITCIWGGGVSSGPGGKVLGSSVAFPIY